MTQMHIKFDVISIKMKLNTYMFTNHQAEGVVYSEDSKEPKTQPWGTPNKGNNKKSDKTGPWSGNSSLFFFCVLVMTCNS